MATSSLPTRPRSPCSESTGWRNEAGLPVEVSVAAILRAISPDLPTPETISRPVAFSSSRTAAEKAGPRRSATRRIASASRTSTRRPRSASSLGSVRDIATLQEVFREQALPLTPGLEDQLGHLSHRALAAGHGRHDSGGGLHLRYAVRHGDREPDPCEQREVRQVIADHPDVDAIVGQHSVDVEADEFEAAGNRSVEHCHLRARAGGTALTRSSTTALPPPWDLAAAVPPARAACHTSRAMLTMPASWSSGIMFGPSDGARSGSGCVSRKKPSAPAAAAA